MEITLGGNKYELKMTLKNLKNFGLVPGNTENNIDLMSDTISGLLTGDPFALSTSLGKLLEKDGVKQTEIDAGLESADNLDELFDKVEDFFETSPLTKKMALKVATPMKAKLASLDK
jgi:hypothetical protein